MKHDELDFALTSVLQQVREALARRADRTYVKYIEVSRSEYCLGWEHKVKQQSFGAPELLAHNTAGNLFGQHKAFVEALTLLDEYMKGER